jgi:AbrB family looped-hinge helix DNA binding protein
VSKVTSKYQVTVPKVIAEKYHIRPGDRIDWVAAGDVIRVIPPDTKLPAEDSESRLRLFDQATKRHLKRPPAPETKSPSGRGWRREDLYKRGRSR